MYNNQINEFRQIYKNNQQISIFRVPSRINLMGVHIEHRGGYVNYMTINKEAVFVVQKRDDDKVELHDMNKKKFGFRSFHINEELPKEKRGNWGKYIQSVKIKQGDWVNYIKSGVLIIQDKFPDKNLKGMNILIDSNIPMSAGLSSSSALVVGSALATIELNDLPVPREELVELCGRGEWYVGTRGGAGDHGAMLFGKAGYIAHMRFFPFQTELVPFPEGYRVIMCNSLVEATKSTQARNRFNEKVATYEIALMLIKKKFPEKTEKFKYLRDVIREDKIWIYQMLKSLPLKITRENLLGEFPEEKNKLENLFTTHSEPKDGYEVRDVCLFGLAECKRGEICTNFLKNNDITQFGKLMYISHDGDRIVSFDENGNKKPWDNQTTDKQLENLIEKDTPEPYMLPGGYRCSCPELDQLVDISRQIPGVTGASLTGAGLGGCILVLIKEDRIDNFLEIIDKKYYRPKKLPLGAEVCIPADRASLI